MTEIAVNQNTNKNSTFSNLKPKIANALNSVWAMAIVSILIVLCWALDFAYVSLVALTLYVVAGFIFSSDNPKTFILPFLAVPLILTSVYKYLYFALVCGGVAIIFFAYTIIKALVKKVRPFKKGKLFWVLVLTAIGNCLGGVIGYFDVLNMFITLGISFLLYLIYWFCINFIKDYKKYIALCFIFLGLIIAAEVIIQYLRAEDILLAFQNKLVKIGVDQINGFGIIAAISVCSCFYLANKSKYDYLYMLLALFFDLIVFITYSRISILLAALATIILFIITAKNSSNKKIIFIALGVLLIFVAVLCIVFFDKIYNLVSYYINIGLKPNGRKSLWQWCWDQFLSKMIFGVGFITKDPNAMAGVYPGIADIGGGYAIISCHNTILHYLVCTGIVGLVLSLPFLVYKYVVLFKSFSYFKVFCLTSVLIMTLASLIDCFTTNSFFHIVILYLILAFAECDKKEQLELSLADSSTKTLKKEEKVKKEKTKEKDKEEIKENKKAKKESKNLTESKNEIKVDETTKKEDLKKDKTSTTKKEKTAKEGKTVEEKQEEVKKEKTTKPKTKKVTTSKSTNKKQPTSVTAKIEEEPKKSKAKISEDEPDTEAKKLTRKIIELSRRNNRNY